LLASSLTNPGEGTPSISPTGVAWPGEGGEEGEEDDDNEQEGGDLEGELGRKGADMTNL